MTRSLRRCSARLAVLVAVLGSALPALGAAPNAYLDQLARREAELHRRARTPGGVLPLLGLRRFWERVPPGEVERVISWARRRGNHPLVQGEGLLLAAEAASRGGRNDEAAALRARAGVLERWLLCGPFDSPSRRGHAEVLAPERELQSWPDLSRTYPGKEQTVRWRSISAFLGEGLIPVGSFVDPARDVTVYLQTLISSQREQPAALRLGSGGALKVFWNGREVLAREVLRAARPDQEAVAIIVQRGVNRLVIKETVEDGRLDLYARLTRPDGSPLDGISSAEQPAAGAALLLPSTRRPPPALSLREWVAAEQKRSRKPGASKELLRDLVLLHTRLAPDDSADRSAERAAERWAEAAGSAASYLALARARSDHDRQREAVVKALSVEKEHAWSLHQLAGMRYAQGAGLGAVQRWTRLLRAHPGFLPAQLQLAETLRTSGFEQLATEQLDGLLRTHPTVALVIRARAYQAQSQHQLGLAERLFRQLLELDHADLAAHHALSEIAIDRGDLQGALAHSEAVLRLAPHLIHLHLDRAKRLAALGRLEEAAAVCERALQVDPHASRPLEEMGHHLLRAGRRTAAREAWLRALALRPQNAELRAYLSFLQPGRPRGRAEQQRVDPAPLIAAARGRPRPDEPGTVLLDLTAVEVHPSGLSRTLHQRLVRLDSTAGLASLGSHVIRFSPDRQQVEVRAARVHRAGGGTEAAIQSESSLNEPWARLWYDTRGRVLRFAGLRPGDVVELEYVIEDVASDNLFADYFGDMVSLREPLRVQRFEYILLTPEQRTIYVRPPKTAGVTHSRRQRDGWREDRWVARDLPRIVGEPGMPGWSEVADYLHVSTYQRWTDVARWYWGLVKEQLRARPTVRETARRLTAGARSDTDKIQAIQNFVARSTRYVGLEFGIHGYKPYAVDQVLARKFGDCKDKASLMVALLGEVGIDAQLVVLRTRNRGDLDEWPASLAAFNHAIVYLPAQRRYLDGTAEFSGSNDLPWQDQAAMALHIGKDGGQLRRTPVLSPDSNLSQRRARWTVEPGGAIRVEESLELRGQPAARWRSHYQVADQRREEYEKAWNSDLGGAKVLTVEMRNLDDLEQPVRATTTLVAQGLAQRDAAGRLSVRVGAQPAAYLDGLSSVSSRRYPLVLDYPWRMKHQLRLAPPPGWRVELQPGEASLTWKQGRFSRRVRRDGEALELETDLQLNVIRVSPAEYGELRRNLLKVERLLGERVVLVRGGGR